VESLECELEKEVFVVVLWGKGVGNEMLEK